MELWLLFIELQDLSGEMLDSWHFIACSIGLSTQDGFMSQWVHPLCTCCEYKCGVFPLWLLSTFGGMSSKMQIVANYKC